MRMWILSVVATVAATAAANAQVQYSDGLPLLKRRPFAPGAQFSPPPPPLPGYDPYAPWAPVVRGPIYSPYSMIRYEWLPVRVIEKLPGPAVPTPIPGPAPLPPGPPATKPPVVPPPADKKPTFSETSRPTMLPEER
jgi:hypothetical protein